MDIQATEFEEEPVWFQIFAVATMMAMFVGGLAAFYILMGVLA